MSGVTNTSLSSMQSPSALTAFLACQHLAGLELARVPRPAVDNAQAELIRRKGDEHERAYLDELRARGLEIEAVVTLSGRSTSQFFGVIRPVAKA
jgi:hypothetical protein